MYENKIVIILFLCCLNIFSCKRLELEHLNQNDFYYYAPYQTGNVGEFNKLLIFPIYNQLYTFDRINKNFEIMCSKDNCSHEYLDYPQNNTCLSAIDRNAYIGIDDNLLYAATFLSDGVKIKTINIESGEQTLLKEFYDYSWSSSNMLFCNSYCYYVTNLVNKPLTLLKKIPLEKNDNVIETVLEIEQADKKELMRGLLFTYSDSLWKRISCLRAANRKDFFVSLFQGPRSFYSVIHKNVL